MMFVRSSVTLGVTSSVANDVIMRIAGSRVANAVGAKMRMTSQWRYGDWRHVATGCNALFITILLS